MRSSSSLSTRMTGAHLARRRGDGTEFHQMREYRTGDSLRQIDWKATARARRLIERALAALRASYARPELYEALKPHLTSDSDYAATAARAAPPATATM